MVDVLASAKEYTLRGWAVTPVLYKEKKAFLAGWTSKPFPNETELEEWFGNGVKRNIGIRTGSVSNNLVVLDCDNESACSELKAMYPQLENTLRSQGKKVGGHLWVYSDEPIKSFNVKDKDGKTVLDVLADGKQVLAPPSEHKDSTNENKIFYQWINYNEPIKVSKRILLAIIEDMASKNGWITKNTEEKTESPKEETRKNTGNFEINLKFSDFIDFSKLSKVGEEYEGEHPVHGSNGGHNFSINPSEGIWHCFRCNSGADVLYLFAVKEGIIDCSDAKAGGLRGDKFKTAVKLAKERFGDNAVRKVWKPRISSDVDYNELINKLQACCIDKKGEIVFTADEARCLIADFLMADYCFVTFTDTDEIYYYNEEEGIYTTGGEVKILGKVQKYMKTAGLETRVKRNFADEILHYIKRSTYAERDTFEEEPMLICLANGVLDLNTFTFEQHSANKRFLSKLAVHYNKEAKCEKFDKFLSEVVTTEDVPVVEEIMGYTLYRDYPIQKAFMFIGEGSNGKSTLLKVMENIIGTANCSNLGLQEIENKGFAIGALYKKYANFYSDLPSTALKTTGRFKMLTGGDTLTADRKHKDHFNFQNYAKLVFSCNQMPATSDDTHAFFRRWIIINFPHRFEGSAKKNLIKEIATKHELSGVLNKAVVGLKRLLEKQDFSYSKSVEEVKEQYIRLSDGIGAFIMDMLQPAPQGEIFKQMLYNSYLDYCRQYNITAETDAKFFREVVARLKVIDSKPLNPETGKQEHAYRGLMFKDNKKPTYPPYPTVSQHTSV